MGIALKSVETLNLQTISMTQFVKIVTMAMRSRMDCADREGSIYSDEALKNLKENTWGRPIMAIGKPGIGKTEIMRSTISRKLNIGIKEVRLGSMQDSDITGLPSFEQVPVKDANGNLIYEQAFDANGVPIYEEVPVLDANGNKQYEKLYDKDGNLVYDADGVLKRGNLITERKPVMRAKMTKFTTFANLKALPHTKTMGGTDPDFGILVLDEITTCNEQVRTVALQLLDSSRSIGESYHLPPGWMIVALGNGPDDGADYAGMPETVISRMAGYYVEPDIEAWYEWAAQNNIHDVVLGYLKQNKEYLFHAIESEYGVQITNPRTWEATSDALRVAERYSKNNVLESDLILPICSSGVGAAIGAKLATFYEFRKDVIPMNEILDGTAIKKYQPSQIRIEALYLGQQAIIRKYLDIGKEYEKELSSKGSIKMTFSMKNTRLNSSLGGGGNSGDALPDKAVNELVNLTNFVMFCSHQAIPGGLDFSINTIESITKASTYSNNQIPRYMAQPNTKFHEKCTQFNEFIQKHQKLLNILHSSGNEAYI